MENVRTNQNQEKLHSCRENEDRGTSGISRQANQEDGRLRSLVVKNGELQISVREGALPQFLIGANQAVKAGQIEEAIGLLSDGNVETVRKTLQEDPSRTDLMFVLAKMFFDTAQLSRAEQWYKGILEQESHALVLCELGRLCQRKGRLTDAVEYQKKAMEAEPSNTGIWDSCALNLIRTGKIQEGINLLRKAVEKVPANAAIHANLLWYLHYLPETDPQALFDEHKRWGRMHAPVSMAETSHENDPDPDRRLRIGYISPDLRRHSVAYNFQAFLNGRDYRAVEVYGYGDIARPDEMTDYFKQKFDRYRNICGIDDKAVARLIEQDKIDILVEIGGHTPGNRLLALAYKPAPIQVDYGGIDTSGMEQIDYRLTDSLLDSPETQKLYTEESVYLPGGLFCYKPVDFTPPVAPLPATRKGHLTFGSFNNNLKVNSYIMSLWAEVLKRNDGSRLLMKFRGGNDRKVADYYLQQFEQFGIGRDRVQIYGRIAPSEHLQLYGEVDITLDTYPLNGGITTLESLWSGVPVISLVGRNSFLSRAGLSILSRVGLETFATSVPEEYIAKATALAANLEELAKMRVSMRQRMAGSILCDATAYAGSVEAAYRNMWHRWCRSRGTDVGRNQPLILQQNRPENGDSEFDISTDGLSRLLLRINAAAEAGEADEVAGILNDRLIEAVRNMVKEDRSQISVMYELATVFCKIGQLNKAEELYREFLNQGQDSFVYNELAHICRRAGRISHAAKYRKKALGTDPNNTWLCSNLGMDLIRAGKTQEGIDMLRQAVEKTSVDASTNTSKDALAHSNFLLHLHYLPELDKQMIFDEHKRWSRIYAPANRARTSHDNVPEPDRRLRVGYISPDFRMHPVAYFFEPLLDGRNHQAVEIYGYANVERPDNFTERLKRKFDHYGD
ncbi:MAG: O-linked N-acetylglucosamine transferase, SPINDLY family protein, partial [Planctomycetota bacterium]